MKLFKTYEHIEGEEYQSNIFLSVGGVRNNNRRGWFMRLESPFVKIVEYVDPDDFIMKKGPCSNVYGWFKMSGIKKIIHHVVLLPLDRKRTTRYKIWYIEP